MLCCIAWGVSWSEYFMYFHCMQTRLGLYVHVYSVHILRYPCVNSYSTEDVYSTGVSPAQSPVCTACGRETETTGVC